MNYILEVVGSSIWNSKCATGSFRHYYWPAYT